MPKTKSADPDPEVRFEDAIERLESIIERMETEQIPLDELLEDYENGTHLLKLCRNRIDSARTRVETINRELADTKPAPDSGGIEGEADNTDDDEIQLL
jgi:exodeoxyribonuclease VII small subunit